MSISGGAAPTDFVGSGNDGGIDNATGATRLEWTLSADADDDEWETLDVVVPNRPSAPETKVMSSTPAPTGAVMSESIKPLQSLHGSSAKIAIQQTNRPSHANQPSQQSRQNSISSSNNNKKSPTPTTFSSPLMNHPMQHVACHFLLHLLREIYHADVTFRLSLLCLTSGAVAQLIEWSCWYILYPERLLVMVSLLLGAGIPAFLYYQPRLVALVQTLQQSSQLEVEELLSRCLDTHQVKAILAIWWFVLPAILELRTLQFLAGIVGCSGSFVTPLMTLFLLLTVVQYQAPDEFRVFCPHKWKQFGLYWLYGTALLLTISHGAPKRHVPSLAARFLLSTAVLLYQSSHTDLSRVVRNALRYTVRDALQQVGSAVQQDELLQLTMLRWIVDFWSSNMSTSSSGGGSNTPSSSSNTFASTSNAPSPPPPVSSAVMSPTAAPVPSRLSNRPNRSRPSEILQFRHEELNWTDLCPMLQTTTNQITNEVGSLQRHCSEELMKPNPTSSAGTPYTGQNTASGNNNSNSFDEHLFGGSVQSLQVMLSSMNLDERAQPAVLAYKEIVNDFPPSRLVAVTLGVVRRAPAILLVAMSICMCLMRLYCRPWTWWIILLPFALLDAMQIRLWIEACRAACDVDSDSSPASVISLADVDPMTILLMDESHQAGGLTSLPTLLVVWRNVHASVEALEVSLTTARCVQTTVVAADFAANVISLASFGLEVSRHGWFHGLSIVVKELLHLQSSGTDPRTLWHGVSAPAGASYTSAAVSAVRNTQTMSRNFQALSNDSGTATTTANHGPIVAGQAALGFCAALIGHGWVWGREHDEQLRAVEIPSIEIVEVEEEDAGEQHRVSAARSSKQTVPSTSGSTVPSSTECDNLSRSFENIAEEPDSSAALCVEKDPTGESKSMLDSEERQAISAVEREEELPFTAGVASEALEPFADTGIDTLQFDITEGGALSVSSDDESPKGRETGDNGNVSLVVASGSGSWDDADVDSSPMPQPDVRLNRRAEPDHSMPLTKTEGSEEEDDNLWLKVGGGLAVFGAVVAGSVALLAAKNGNKGDEKKKNQDAL